jgi:hypothetical protein
MKDDDEKGIRAVRIGPLRTIGAIASEIARIYRCCRRGEITSQEFYRLCAGLQVLRQCIEAGEIEARLMQIEQQINERKPHLQLVDNRRKVLDA